MKFTICFLSALKKQLLLLFIASPFFLVPAFAMTPVSFFEKPDKKTSAELSDERLASSREEGIGDSSSMEPRGRRLTAVELVERDSVGRNEDINMDEHEFAVIDDNVRRNSEEHFSIITRALHEPQEDFSASDHFSSVAMPVVTISQPHHFDASPGLPITAVHSSEYLKNLRSRLFPQHDSSSDEHQIMETEMAVNRAALADGLSPEELRVLRAQETREFFLPAFKAVQKLVMSTSLHFYNLTRETTKLPPEVWDKYSEAVQRQKEIFESCQEAEQELEAALDAWKVKGGVSVVATEIRDEEDSSR
ncbi:MAG: hypothetical protein WCO92_03625 [Verrucomicrobiota bacterium]